MEKTIKALPAVSEVEAIADYLKEDQTNKLKIIKDVKQDLSDVICGEPDPRPVNVRELSLSLYSLYGYLGAALEETKTEDPELSKHLIEPLKSQGVSAAEDSALVVRVKYTADPASGGD